MALDPTSELASRVDLLRRQYLQLVDLERLAIPNLDSLRLPDVQAEIFQTMFDEETRPFPSPDRYKFRVLKKIVDALEEAVVDHEDDV